MRVLKVLILDDEPIVGKRLKPALSKYGLDVEVFEKPELAVARINEQEFDIVVTDVRMESMNGLTVLDTVASTAPNTKVIVITGYASPETAREALSRGAFDFIAKPFKASDLRVAIDKAARALGHPGIGPVDA